MVNCDIIAFHGWGFNRDIWKSWGEKLLSLGTFRTYDRGHFNNPEKITSSDANHTVLIAHSFGLHWIDEVLFEQTDLLVIIGGFMHFHPFAAQYKRRSRTILQQMINECQVHPEKVLRNFYSNCYAPQEFSRKKIENLNFQLLLDDLKHLNQSKIEAEKLKRADKISIIHGSDDHIVPKAKGREIFNRLPEKSKYFEIKHAGHALPDTHRDQCLGFIKPEIENVLQKIQK